jgi:diguanylate cyclase (GGDEF)-like protein
LESQTSTFETPVQPAVISFNHHTPSSMNKFDEVQFIHTLLLQLIRTVDVDELLTLFYHSVQQTLPLESLTLITDDTRLIKGRIETHAPHTMTHSMIHSINLALTRNENKGSGTQASLRYRLTRQLSVMEDTLLTKVHNAVSHLMIHALHFAKLNQLATKDPLTGLGNRSSFDEDSYSLHQAYLRQAKKYGLLVLDLDNFKTVNDRFGHQEGDNLLLTFAQILNDSLRANEKAYRFGGDEFCCLIETEQRRAIDSVARRIMRNAAKNDLLKRHGVTVSIGGSVFSDNETVTDIFNRADKALYEVKQKGKQGYLFR